MKKILLAAGILVGLVCPCLLTHAAEAPVPSAENGMITAEEWEETFPEIVASYNANAANSYRISYLDTDPYLKNIYEGYGFAKDYTSAVGHSYCLEDVYKTERPHALANCLTCKTADFTKMVNDLGEEVYSYDFEELYGSMVQSVGCYSCHENKELEEENLAVTHSYITLALGEEYDGIDPSILTCGQCHIEYYFDPETKATRMPHSDIASMGPEATLAFYDEMGFADWTQESTGARMLKAQHPELETYLSGSFHANMGLTCADCHMGKSISETGTEYVNHTWRSPLEDAGLLQYCAQCHKDTDMAQKVHAIQAEITTAEKELGMKLSDLKDGLAAAVASGKNTEEQLDEVRSLYRSAQWYWDYCYVENAEGAHNSAFARDCLAKSEELIDQAMDKLGVLEV
ncbi:MAG: ammonia-forming cytochrome c nitrite reductase subunit c552 [Blautia sp.]|nr:ammonia-forming cytochrome c nitrite reductase subunit c552 [Blautia sp.]